MNVLEVNYDEDAFQASITPMIDVVFLLIIFFMLVTQFSSQILEQNIVLPPASEAVADKGINRMVVNVDRNGTYSVMGMPYTIEELASLMGSFREKRLRQNENNHVIVMIRADQAAAYRHILNVYSKLQDHGIWQVQFAAEKTSPQR